MKTFSLFMDILLFRINKFIRINIFVFFQKIYINRIDINFFLVRILNLELHLNFYLCDINL